MQVHASTCKYMQVRKRRSRQTLRGAPSKHRVGSARFHRSCVLRKIGIQVVRVRDTEADRRQLAAGTDTGHVFRVAKRWVQTQQWLADWNKVPPQAVVLAAPSRGVSNGQGHPDVADRHSDSDHSAVVVVLALAKLTDVRGRALRPSP